MYAIGSSANFYPLGVFAQMNIWTYAFAHEDNVYSIDFASK